MLRPLLAAIALAAPCAQSQCIPEWTPGFGATGVGGPVSATVVYDDGTGRALFAGGLFTQAGGVTVKNIARWNGASWAPLANGLSATVRALAPFDPDGPGPLPVALYAGGDFAGGVAKWDGGAWITVPGGPDGVVRALAVFDDGSGPALYAGGDFTTVGGSPASRIARWNGQAWSTLGAGIGGNVYALAAYTDADGPALYAGGLFTQAGGNPASRIARWSGLAWTALGSGTSGAVTALAVHDDGSGPSLFVGGLFNTAGGNPASRIARWNGADWFPLDGGVSDIVYAFTVHNDGDGPALFVGGQFTQADGKNASRIARWDGPAKGWKALGAGTNNNVFALASYTDDRGPALIAGGEFTGADEGAVNYVAQWREEAWSGLGAAVNERVYGLASFDDGSGIDLYAAGQFTTAGGVVTKSIARWNGASWSPLDTGLNAAASGVTTFDDGTGQALYVCGAFTSAGGMTANRIARWNGAAWSALDDGTNAVVNAMTVYDDGSGPALYAGGNFTTAGGQSAVRIARWDGLQWTKLSIGITGGEVRALAVFDDGAGPSLYAAGDFLAAGGNSVNRIARWNGLAWSALGSGINNTVYALITFDDGSGPALYAAGQFTSAGGKAVSNIARWNGLAWSGLGTGLNGTARALAVHDDGSGPALFATGEFTSAGGNPAPRFAKWDGLQWSAPANGINGTGFALASLPESDTQSALFVGGLFPTAGGIPSSNIARWGCPILPTDLCELPLLTAPAPTTGDFFGQACAISGDAMVVGAFGDDAAGDEAGAAYFYARNGSGGWSFAQTAIPADLIAGDFFGASAAIDGDFAIIGAPRSDPAGVNSGAAYIYRFANGLWAQEAKLVPSDAAAADQFGFSVAILGDAAIVGAWRADLPSKANAGAAYVFTRQQGAWIERDKLIASDAAANDNLGASVALAPDFAIAGAPGDDNAGGADAGAAYVYFRVGDQWGDWQKLTPLDGAAGDQFGFAVAGDADRLIIGAPGVNALGEDAGLAYAFRVTGGAWKAEDTLFPSGIKPGDALGTAVAVRGLRALVGGNQSDRQGEDSGAVSLFERSGTNWFESAKLIGKAIGPGDYLGASVAIGPAELAAGAIFADAPGSQDQGGILLYSTGGCPCYPDFTGDGNLDLFDFLGFVNAFNAQQPAADCDNSATLDLFDFLCFTNAFNTGC